MSRPIKKGLDYFPVDTTILSDIKIRRIKRKYGAESFLLYIALLCDIYASGFYLEVTDDYLFELSEQLGIPENRIGEILTSMTEIGLFLSTTYQENRILTSAAIQKRYLLAKGKRIDSQSVEQNEYWVLSDRTPVMPDKTPINPSESAQRKVKESKGKDSSSTSSLACAQKEKDKAEPAFGECCNSYREELLADEDWQASIARVSGKGPAAIQLLPEVMDAFYLHIVSIGQTGEIQTKNEYASWFVNWWRCLKFRPAAEIDHPEATPPRQIYPGRTFLPGKPPISKIEQAIQLSREVEQRVKQMLPS